MNTDKIIPVGDYLLVSIMKEEQERQGALILNTKTADNKGVVLAIGDKVNTDDGSTKILKKDVVIFNPGSGVNVTNSEDSDILISVKNIIGIIRGK